MNVKNVTFMPCVQTDTANANMATLGMDINVKKVSLIHALGFSILLLGLTSIECRCLEDTRSRRSTACTKWKHRFPPVGYGVDSWMDGHLGKKPYPPTFAIIVCGRKFSRFESFLLVYTLISSILNVDWCQHVPLLITFIC